jgi:hypothetical protein
MSTLTLSSFPLNAGVVSGEGIFNCRSSVQAKAKANPGFKFFAWQNMANGYLLTYDSIYAFSINSNLVLRAIFHVNTGIYSDAKRIGFYPNPCHDYLYLEDEIKQYQIFNSEGKFIKEGEEQTIEVKSLLPGIYLLELIDAYGYKSRYKFVKE